MRTTQVEILTRDGVTRVYWLDDDPYNNRGLEIGQQIMLVEMGVWTTIVRKMVSVSDELKPWLVANLKARLGTILELSSA